MATAGCAEPLHGNNIENLGPALGCRASSAAPTGSFSGGTVSTSTAVESVGSESRTSAPAGLLGEHEDYEISRRRPLRLRLSVR